MWNRKKQGKAIGKNNNFYLNKITGFFYDHTFCHNFCCYNLMICKIMIGDKSNFSLIFFQIIFFLPFIITHLRIVTICNKSCVHRLSDKIILIVMFYVLLKKKKKMSHSMSIEGKILLTSELKRKNVLVDLV